MPDHKCTKCGEICEVDGEYPRWFAWCHECNDYAAGFDCLEYGADYMGAMADAVKDEGKYRNLMGG